MNLKLGEDIQPQASAWAETLGSPAPTRRRTRVIGILPGEGVGPEVLSATLRVLDAIEAHRPLGIERVTAPTDLLANGDGTGELSERAEGFGREIFQAGGVLFCGPCAGRFVYDLRRRFDLFCKLVPIKPAPALRHATRFKPETLRGIDILLVRDNAGGVYQGQWGLRRHSDAGELTAWQNFSYTASDVERIVNAGAKLARSRRQCMHVVVKDGGVPAISDLWKQVAREAAERVGIAVAFLNADYAAYRMIHEPQALDVIVTPNMIGDILADLAAALLGSRGVSFSGNFAADGRAAYQTGHGAALDLAGTGRANPAGQILSLAMLLRESFGAWREAQWIEQALELVWEQGWRTEDVAEPGCRCVGVEEMGARVAEAAAALAAESGGAEGER